MKSEWRVCTNLIGSRTLFRAYRIRDLSLANCGKNIEYDRMGYVSSFGLAQARADALNEKERKSTV